MIITFGEMLLRLSPPGYLRLPQTQTLNFSFGGAEANVAASLAFFGKSTGFVTGLPDNDLGQMCKAELRRWNINTDEIVTRPGRLGIYFCEKGVSQRPSKVLYDRSGSVLSQMQPEAFNWERILRHAEWFHFTGITPALGNNMEKAVLDACRTAKKFGVKISCDPNYRRNLWDRQTAENVLSQILPYVDVLITNDGCADEVFGIRPAKQSSSDELFPEDYRSVAEQLTDRFGIKTIALTIRKSISASCNRWSAVLYDSKKLYTSLEYTLQVVDRVGGGDSFAAGLIYGITEGYEPSLILEFATAASCLKHSVEGDVNFVSAEEVLALVQGDGTGRILR